MYTCVNKVTMKRNFRINTMQAVNNTFALNQERVLKRVPLHEKVKYKLGFDVFQIFFHNNNLRGFSIPTAWIVC